MMLCPLRNDGWSACEVFEEVGRHLCIEQASSILSGGAERLVDNLLIMTASVLIGSNNIALGFSLHDLSSWLIMAGRISCSYR